MADHNRRVFTLKISSHADAAARSCGAASFRPRQAVRIGLLALIGCMVALEPVRASDKNEQDRARAAVLAGEVLPLVKVLERLQRTHPGQVLEVELEREDGRWVYEIKLLRDNGQLVKMHVDARTAAVLDVRSRQRP
jgi:Peptidase propeptide and YPEB domain